MRAEQASATARSIALGTLALAANPQTRDEVAPGAAELCRVQMQTHWSDRWFAAFVGTRLGGWVWHVGEKLVWPGITSHYWRRKRWIEARCRAALADGTARVVVLGAGLDTLALRLAPEFPGVAFVEVDHPATQALKRSALAASARPIPANLEFAAFDLTEGSFSTRLQGDPAPTVVIAEGLLMYLAPADVESLLRAAAGLAAARVTLLFTFMIDLQPNGKLLTRWLRSQRESFLSVIPPDELPMLLRRNGFTLRAHVSGTGLAAERGRHFRGEDVAEAAR